MLTFYNLINGASFHKKARYFGGTGELGVAKKLGLAAFVGQACPLFKFTRGPCLVTLAVHGLFKALFVHGQPLFAADISGEVKRKAKGVVEHEGSLAIERLPLPQGSNGLR